MSRSDRKGLIPDEAKLGFAFLLAIIMFVWGLFFLKDIRLGSGNIFVKAVFENISGVGNKDPVLYRGIKIGQVTEVGLEDQLPYALMRISDSYPIPVDSYVEAMDRSLMGEKGLEIHQGTSTQLVGTGDYLEGRAKGSLLDMSTTVDSLSFSLQTVLGNVNAILDSNLDRSIEKNLGNMEELTSTLTTTLKQERRQIHKTLVDLDSLILTMDDISGSEKEKISRTMTNLEKTSGQLSGMITKLEGTTASLDTILKGLERGEGTLGKMLKDDKLYLDMDILMVNLNELVVDLKENPKKYLSIEIF